jgi:hypothetical protein
VRALLITRDIIEFTTAIGSRTLRKRILLRTDLLRSVIEQETAMGRCGRETASE